MKKIVNQTWIAVLGLVVLAGCTPSTRDQVKNSIADNQKASSLSEWEASEFHPEHLFHEWRETTSESERRRLQKEICENLKALDGQSLTVFEQEIEALENQEFVAPCREELSASLEFYYAEQRTKLSVAVNALRSVRSGNRFKFSDNIQKRDLSNGYYAVSGDVAPKEVVLTFDDGPSGVYTPSILRSLKEVNAKSMFFTLGKNVRLNPQILKQVAGDGHVVGSHSNTHTCIGNRSNCARHNGRLLTFAEAVSEIQKGHQAIYDVLGWVDPIFRFPFGESSPELKNYLRQNSIGEFYWAVDSEDWKAQTNENMIRNTMAQVERRGRGILLFHDIQRKTAEALPQLLSELYYKGYSVVLLTPEDANARYNSKIIKKNKP